VIGTLGHCYWVSGRTFDAVANKPDAQSAGAKLGKTEKRRNTTGSGNTYTNAAKASGRTGRNSGKGSGKKSGKRGSSGADNGSSAMSDAYDFSADWKD